MNWKKSKMTANKQPDGKKGEWRRFEWNQPALTSNGRLNSRRASRLRGRFSSSTAPVGATTRAETWHLNQCTTHTIHCGALCSIWSVTTGRQAADISVVTFQQGDGELIRVEVADILAQVRIQYPGNKTLQHSTSGVKKAAHRKEMMKIDLHSTSINC